MKKPTPSDRLRWQRRDLLRIAAGLPAAALAGAPRAAAAPAPVSAPPGSPAPAHPRVLNPHEWRTLRLLADWILPADAISGSAGEAAVPEFIDDWLRLKRGLLPDQIRGGLVWLDLQCRRAYGRRFAGCSRAQQQRMLDRIAYPAKAAPGDAPGVEFFNRLRDLVVSGFYTSRMGVRDLPYLGNEPQSAWNGCPPAVVARLKLD